LYVQAEYVQGYQAHPQQTQALPSPGSFHKHPHVTLLPELALIVQPITVRDEQLLETSGKILDHIVSGTHLRSVSSWGTHTSLHVDFINARLLDCILDDLNILGFFFL
jgi:hypothetical protein